MATVKCWIGSVRDIYNPSNVTSSDWLASKVFPDWLIIWNQNRYLLQSAMNPFILPVLTHNKTPETLMFTNIPLEPLTLKGTIYYERHTLKRDRTCQLSYPWGPSISILQYKECRPGWLYSAGWSNPNLILILILILILVLILILIGKTNSIILHCNSCNKLTPLINIYSLCRDKLLFSKLKLFVEYPQASVYLSIQSGRCCSTWW